MEKASVEAINSALIRIKSAIRHDPDCFVFERRPENLQTITDLGITPKHVAEEICRLTYKNYYRGPAPKLSQRGRHGGEVWEFGTEIDGTEIYIKVQIIPTKRFTNCVCISFHYPERPIIYPYKE